MKVISSEAMRGMFETKCSSNTCVFSHACVGQECYCSQPSFRTPKSWLLGLAVLLAVWLNQIGNRRLRGSECFVGKGRVFPSSGSGGNVASIRISLNSKKCRRVRLAHVIFRRIRQRQLLRPLLVLPS